MKFAIILAGCGQHDGSEIHEVVMTLLAVEAEGIQWHAYAPNRTQAQVINHLTNTPVENASRNILEESARVVRGRISPLDAFSADNYDAVIFPGGFGAATNWCNWLTHDTGFNIETDIQSLVDQAKAAGHAFGFICIAPIMITRLFDQSTLTIGNDDELAAKIAQLGATHINCAATDIVIDEHNRVVSTPANMLAENLLELKTGIHKLIRSVAELVRANQAAALKS